MADKFSPPDEAALRRMSIGSIDALLETLKQQRAAKVENIDEEIGYYENLRKEKLGA